ncbi:hypothetical protein BCP8-2_096 [Bacillus phage BCP8-2]|uniref:Uncharacterized protein n=1 Tax=Bacillus phage BCP8-2 TaxID=1129192 RepID=A0A0E3D9A6_9CAUD|nr:hypothetical protein BCP8-2_096 [Bacillus phage BCP8-2]AHJ87134.1 hypothetical protein BCP8-2_096 [Bacillus phage BCP8-2]
MTVYEHRDVAYNFDEVMKDMQKLKDHTLRHVQKTEEMVGIKPKQHLKTLHIHGVEVKRTTGTGYYDKSLYISIIIPKAAYEAIEDKTIISGFPFSDAYSKVHIKLKIVESNKDRLEEFKKAIHAVGSLDLLTHLENINIAKENDQLLTNIFNMLDKAGIRRSHYGYKTKRSSKQTELYYNFPSEIRGQIATSYREGTLEARKQELLKQVDNIWNQEMKKIEDERKEQERIEKEKKENRTLALLLAKYDLDIESDWDDLLQAIIEKNKYLFLAHRLEQNRGDWTDGCSYAESGLDNFTIETEQDKKIHEDIYYYISTWDKHLDGRVFRDCEYDYGTIFGIAADSDSDLYTDYETVKQKVDVW